MICLERLGCRFFYEGNEPPEKPKLPSTKSGNHMWGASAPEREGLRAFAKTLSRMNEGQRKLLLATAMWMARGKRK
jgi:hypothetical protein